jgi:1-acyl-sn-glycerol-3-phosphate acyltransferase
MAHIPATGPVLFVANHNSAFMDPIVLAVHIKRPIYFLARGESFKSKLVSLFFTWLHMIPIYRPEITPDEVHKNRTTFQKCFEHLKQGKTIMIFPEGSSMTDRTIRPLKTGIARISLGAEEQYDFSLGVQIIPIGINYSNPHYFRSDVFIRFGAPILLDEYQSSYLKDPIKTVQDLTNVIHTRLEKLIVLVRDESIVLLVRDIERLYRSSLREELAPKHQASQDFYLSRQIVKAVAYHKQKRPKLYQKFQQKIRQYFEGLDQHQIRDTEFRKPGTALYPNWSFFYFIIGFPWFLYGYLVNIGPYKTAAFLSRKVIVRKDFIGSMKLVFGMFVFLLFYILQMLLVAAWTTWYWGIVFVLSFYPSGVFTLNYLQQWYRHRAHSKYLKLKRDQKDLIHYLKTMREELLEELDAGRQWYLEGIER